MRQEELRKHIAECPSCSEIVESLSSEYHLFAEALAATPLPPDLESLIKLRLTALKHEGGRPLWFMLPAIGIAGLLIAAYNGWNLFEQVWTLARYLGTGDFLLQLLFTVTGVIFEFAGSILRGQPVLPSLTILVLCLLWMKIKLAKGGRVHV